MSNLLFEERLLLVNDWMICLYFEPGTPTTHIQEVFYFYFTQRPIRNTIHFYFVLLLQYSQCVQLVLGVLLLNTIAYLYYLTEWLYLSVYIKGNNDHDEQQLLIQT